MSRTHSLNRWALALAMLAMVTLAAAVAWKGLSGQVASTEGRLLSEGPGSAQWSPDGAYLFYRTGEANTVCRLRIADLKRERFHIPGRPTDFMNTFLVGKDENELYVLGAGEPWRKDPPPLPVYHWDLTTDRVEPSGTAGPDRWPVAWLSGNRFLANGPTGLPNGGVAGLVNVYETATDGNSERRLQTNVRFVQAAQDGSGFLYAAKGRYHFYDTRVHRSRAVSILPPPSDGIARSLKVRGLTAHGMLYEWTSPVDPRPMIVLDFKTGRSRRFPDVRMLGENCVSPAFDSYWVGEQKTGHWDTGYKLYLRRLPAEITAALLTGKPPSSLPPGKQKRAAGQM